MGSLAGSIGGLDLPEWQAYLESEGGADGAIASRLEAYGQLGTELGIRTRPAAILSGPGGTRTLQDGPCLARSNVRLQKSAADLERRRICRPG